MSDSNTPPPPSRPVYSPWGGILSYLIPGLGQIVQGRVSKGVFFMVVLLGMFHAGQAMGGWKNVYLPVVISDANDPRDIRRGYNPLQSVYHRWHFGGQFFIGIAAWPAIWQFYEMPMPAEEASAFLYNFQTEPMHHDKYEKLMRRRPQPKRADDPNQFSPSPEGQLNREIVAGNKTWDLGWIYTVIAGVLNILVIYDAVAGPAFGHKRQEPPKTAPGEAVPT